MKSNSTTLIAVIVVAVLAVAAVGGYMMLNNDKSDSDIDEYAFPIMGNANNDNIIDRKDIDLLEKIIDENLNLADYPLADANVDGKIDQADIDVVTKLMNGENTPVYIIDQDNKLMELSYPLNNIVTVNADMLTFIIQIGAVDKLAGYICSDKYPVAMKVAVDSAAIDLKGGNRAIDAANYLNLINLDASLKNQGGIGAVLVMNDSAAKSYADNLEDAGIALPRVKCSAPIDSINASLTIGFLLGPEIEANARAYYNASYEVLEIINEKLKDLREDEKVKCLSLCMNYYVSEKESAYTLVSELGGGNNISNLEGNGSTKLESADAITIYDEAKYLISYSTMDYVNSNPITVWENSKNNILKASSAYKEGNLVFINVIIPVPCRVAYVAELLYPDLIESGFGDETLQSFIDEFLPYLALNNGGTFDVTADMTPVITKEMYDLAKGSA